MKRVVRKYEVPRPTADGRAVVLVPHGAQFLSVAMQGGDMVVWAMCNPDPDSETGYVNRELLVLQTGQEVELDSFASIDADPHGQVYRFLGTVVHEATLVYTAPVVWHVFVKGAA